MGLKTILVCLTTENNVDQLMKAAVSLAREHDAHLIGLHTMEALMVYPGIALHVPGPAFSEFNSSQRKQAAIIEKAFHKYTDNEDFISEWRLVKAESATASDRMVEFARAADLVIVSQEDRENDRVDQYDIQDHLIRRTGRPILMIPLGYDGKEIGKKITLGWSETREATRAAHDLLPLAREGAEIYLLHAGKPAASDDLTDFSINELAEMYSRHGCKATVVHREIAGQSIAEILTREAFERGSDMIASGAFGHSRTYDFIIGAVTNDLLREAKIPVLFSK